ncbi:hypothetical protein B0H13DRAFT_2338693 [Mycena leptocephala]|nr:hypothetical protein B0H13DRAFT_2338693 [Mycena leptocephala]
MNLKHIFALLLSVTVGLISATEYYHRRRRTSDCDPADALPFYRLLAGTVEYLYLADPAIVQSDIRAGWTLQTVAALVFATQEVSTVPLYTLFLKAGGKILYVADQTELANALNNGYGLSGEPEVYIYPTQICGSVPFYYLNNAAKKI